MGIVIVPQPNPNRNLKPCPKCGHLHASPIRCVICGEFMAAYLALKQSKGKP